MFGQVSPEATPTALDEAILTGDLERVKRAIKGGAKLSRPMRGHHPLMWAATTFLTEGRLNHPHALPTDHLAIFDLLLKKNLWKAQPPEDRAAFLPTLVQNPWPRRPSVELDMGAPERLSVLIERLTPLGLDVNGVNAAGETALFPAFRAGHGRWIAALIGLGVDPTRPRPDGRYPHQEPGANRTDPNWTTLVQVLDAQVRAAQRADGLAQRPSAPVPSRPRYRS